MSEMVERMATAIFHAANGATSTSNDHCTMHMAIEAAHAAIEAMREPTDDMCSAFNHEIHEAPAAKWRAMVDAALKEPADAQTK